MKTAKNTKQPKTSRSKAVDCSQEVSWANSTVNGYPARSYWRGLRFNEAEPREKSAIMVLLVGSVKAPVDVHLSVPFCAKGEEHLDSSFLGRFRVRPKDDKVTGAELRQGKWFWVYS